MNNYWSNLCFLKNIEQSYRFFKNFVEINYWKKDLNSLNLIISLVLSILEKFNCIIFSYSIRFERLLFRITKGNAIIHFNII